MSLQKNVASQKIQFLMVDATDFATPETGITVTAKYNKDGGGLSTCSNTVSEVTSGLYVVTLAQTETNADVVAFQLTGTGCADQWLIFYPDSDPATITSIIDDTSKIHSTLDNATFGLDALETIVSLIKSTIDGPVDSAITENTSLLDHVLSTLDGQIISDLSSIEADVASILVDTGTTLDNKIDSVVSTVASVLVDTGTTLENRTVSIVNQTSQILASVISTLDGPIQTDLNTILTDTSSTLDNKIDSILSTVSSILTDTGTTLDNRQQSILADTQSIIVDISLLQSEIDGPTSAALSQILADTGDIQDDWAQVVSDISNIESIIIEQGTAGSADWSASERAQIRSALGVSGTTSALENYGVISRLDNATYGLDALETLNSLIKSTLDGPITSDLSSIESTVSYLEGAGGGDWGAKEKAQIRSALGVSGATSSLEAYGIKSELDGAITNFLTSIIDDTSKIHSTLDGPITSDLSSIESTVSYLEGAGGGDWGAKEKQQIRSALGISGATSALENYGISSKLGHGTYGLSALENLVDAIESTLDGPITSDLSNIESIVVAQGTAGAADWTDSEKAQIRSALGVSGATSALEAYGIKSELEGAITNYLTSIVDDTSKVHSTLDGPILSTLDRNQTDLDAILLDTSSTLDNKLDSILADTNDIQGEWAQVVSDVSNVETLVTALGGDSNSISSILSDTKSILSTLDGPILSTLDRNQTDLDLILTDTSSTLDNKLDSILEDTKEINSQCDSILADTGTTLDNKIDSILSTTASILTDTNATLDNKIDSILSTVASILVDTGTTLDAEMGSILDYASALKKTLVNKLKVTEADGTAALFASDDTTSTVVASAFQSDGTHTVRKRMI